MKLVVLVPSKEHCCGLQRARSSASLHSSPRKTFMITRAISSLTNEQSDLKLRPLKFARDSLEV